MAKNVKGGNPRGTPPRCTSPRHEAGRRRAIGAVAALSRHPRATAPMGRRSGASDPEANQKAGAPGRHGVRRGSTPVCQNAPLPLGHANPLAAGLKVGPAPPYRQASSPSRSLTPSPPSFAHSQMRWRCDVLSEFRATCEPDVLDFVIRELHAGNKVPLMPCHPRDLLGMAVDHAVYAGEQRRITTEHMRWAWENYFVSVADYVDPAEGQSPF